MTSSFALRTSIGRIARWGSVMALAAAAACAHASTSHALILAIGEYGTGDPADNLPGIDIDANLARQMVQRLGVPASNVSALSNAQLTRNALVAAFSDLERRLATNDNLVIYFSGHGARFTDPRGSGCSEAMVLRGLELFTDAELQQVLQRLSQRVRQVVMFNDSCFSGGAATKSASTRSAVPRAVLKQPKPGARLAVAGRSTEADPCSLPINAFMRNFALGPAQSGAPAMVYLAAAADNEVAFATPNGSAATVAWNACLSQPGTDADNDGIITADELHRCAQGRVRSAQFNQTLGVTGKGNLPLVSLTSNSAASDSHVALLAEIEAGADRSSVVDLTLIPAQASYRIGQDGFRMRATLSRPGYLYVVQAGSDGTLSPIYPAAGTAGDLKAAGSYMLPPDQRYRYTSQGPAGVSRFLAIVSPERIDLLEKLRPKTPLTRSMTRNFAEGPAPGTQTVYWASSILAAQEVRP
jgi:hypothetical protein